MSIETDLYAALSAVAPTWPTVAPSDAALPRITYQLVGGADISGYEADGTGAHFIRCQIDCWAGNYGAARKLADQARQACYDALTVGEITDNPTGFDNTTELHRASFDVKAWA